MPDNKYDVSRESEITIENCLIELHMVEMCDGTKLETIVYRPCDKSRHHVVLTRTPYDHRDRINAPQKRYLEKGLIYIFQVCRGNGLSEGEFHPFVNEASDGNDTLNWIKEQSWFGGRIAMTGGSYSGLTQWLLAINAPDELVAIATTVSCSNVHDKLFIGGAFFLQLHMHWGMTMIYRSRFGNHNIPEWDNTGLVKHLPLSEMDEAAGLGTLNFWRSWFDKNEDENYWEPYAINHHYENVKTPVYMTGGWYDFYTDGTLENFMGMRTRGGSENARKFTRCVIGPWGHTGLMNPDVFGKNTTPDQTGKLLEDFRDNMLFSPDADPLPEEPPLRYFMMGKNEWRSSDEWPPVGVKETCYYLHSEDCANTRFGTGKLNIQKPAKEPEDTFIYDPRNPVQSRGGCFLGPGKNGCLDQRELEARSDILVYVSDILSEELEIAGKVTVKLFASTNSLDTDFTAKLVDIHPDGKSLNVCDGIIRGRYRHSKFKPELLEPDKIYEFEIDCWNTAHCFLKGHRIGLDISSSNFPRFDRNPNTGSKIGFDDKMKLAHQIVYHSAEYPSCLVLPIIQ